MYGLNHKTLPIENFSGGLKTRGNIFFRKDPGVATSPDCNAVVSTTGKTLSRILGYTKLTSVQKTGTARGIYNYSIGSGNHKQLVQFGTVMYKMDGYDGTLDELQTGLSNTRAEFDTFTSSAGVQTLLYANHGQETMRSWDGSAGSMSDITGAPRCKFMKVWKNRIWTANIFGTPSRLQWSNLNSYTTWTATDVDDGFTTPEGDEITGMGLLRGRLYIFKENNIFRVSYLGGTPLFEITHVISGTGTQSSHSIKNAILLVPEAYGGTTTQEVLVFVTSSGKLMAFDGTFVVPISEAIEDDNGQSFASAPLMNKGALATTHAITLGAEHQTWFFLPYAADTTPSHLMVFENYTSGLWPAKGFNFEASAMVYDSNNIQVPLGAKDGYLYRLNSGNTYDGTAIDAYYTLDLIDYDDNSLLKKGGHFEITCRLRGSSSLQLQHRNDFEGTYSPAKTLTLTGGDRLGISFTLGTSKLGGPRAGTMIYPFPFCVDNTQLKIIEVGTNASAFEIYKIDFVGAGLGRAKA